MDLPGDDGPAAGAVAFAALDEVVAPVFCKGVAERRRADGLGEVRGGRGGLVASHLKPWLACGVPGAGPQGIAVEGSEGRRKPLGAGLVLQAIGLDGRIDLPAELELGELGLDARGAGGLFVFRFGHGRKGQSRQDR